MSILTIMEAKLDQLTQGEAAIARFVLDHPDRVLRFSSAELAEATRRSQSGVVKFCQKLGFAGYQDFKIAVSRAEGAEPVLPDGVVHGTIDSGDSHALTAQKLIGSKIHAMQRTLSVNDEKSIDDTIEALGTARRILLTGVGASSLVARDFAYKLQKVGALVLFVSDTHIQVANAATLDQRDTVFAFSHSGTSLETLKVAQTAHAAGARLISMTGLHANPLMELAELRLFTVPDEDKVRSSSITARDTQLMLTDLLFIRMLQKKPHLGEFVQNAARAVSELKPGTPT